MSVHPPPGTSIDLTLCIAARGRPVELERVITETDARVADPARVTISVALDDDDESLSSRAPPTTRSRLVWDVGPREDSLGAKYNRCARNAPSDMYVLGADDNVFATDSWDAIISQTAALFPEQFGFVYFGRLDGTLPTNMAIPHGLIEAQGFMFPEHWPFWFHDTWTDEIAHMIGRVLWANIEVEEIGGRGKTRGLREVPFWTALFDTLRNERVLLARRLSEEINPQWLDIQLRQRQDILNLFFGHRMMRLRNPATAIHFERRMSYDDKPTERYLRIRQKAETLISELARVVA